jgi:hypothetical protein
LSGAGSIRGSLAAVVCVLLAWQIVTRTVATLLADSEPRLAMRLDPGNSEAVLRLADRMLGQDPGQDKDDPERVPVLNSPAPRALATELMARGVPFPFVTPDIAVDALNAIRRSASASWLDNPLDARAPRLLGQTAEDTDSGRALMRRARVLSMHETLAVYWLMQDAFLGGDMETTLAYSDILLRAHPELATFVVPVLTRAAARPDGLRFLKTALERRPPWRSDFFQAICPGLGDMGLPKELLSDLVAAGAPPAQEEVAPYLNCLVSRGDYALARTVWLDALHGADAGRANLLWDGNFHARSSGALFDWGWRADGGVRVEYDDAPDRTGQTALRLDFLDQFINVLEVTQTVVLRPGEYVLSGELTGEFSARHGLRWSIACAARPGASFATSDRLFGRQNGWKQFSFAFKVPAENCPAQILSLGIDSVSDSERIVSGAAWFANLELKVRD